MDHLPLKRGKDEVTPPITEEEMKQAYRDIQTIFEKYQIEGEDTLELWHLMEVVLEYEREHTPLRPS